MRVLQLIDSLDAGGAERMAVNLANGLSSKIDGSFLCVSRKEGLLKKSINNHVSYLFLNKKQTVDFKAILKLNRLIRKNKIKIIHAHGTSFFLGTLIKLLNPKLILIWHDHYGKSEFLDARPKFVLKQCSRFFNHILCVNSKLENWVKQELNITAVNYISNYAVLTNSEDNTVLKGLEGKRIVCLANLRPQKDHFNLLKAFKLINNERPDWSLHLVGHNFDDSYSKAIKAYIYETNLLNHIFIYGSCSDTFNILQQSTIGVLASKSEGLPLSLLEYGLAELPVVATNVGDCNKVVSNTDEGFLVDSDNDIALAKALSDLIHDKELRERVAHQLQIKVLSSFSEASSIELLISIYKTHLK